MGTTSMSRSANEPDRQLFHFQNMGARTSRARIQKGVPVSAIEPPRSEACDAIGHDRHAARVGMHPVGQHQG